MANRQQGAATAADVAQLAGTLGYEFSGDELLRRSAQKVVIPEALGRHRGTLVSGGLPTWRG